jgi:hypothetical protein
VGSSSISLQARLIQIAFAGDKTNIASYELLEGLLPGQNITWNVGWQQSILNGLQLNLTYDGRKSEELQVIHIGRVQVTALF